MTSGLLVVLQKEFVDQLTNRRFLTIFALFLIISAIGVHDGANQYNAMLASYAQRMQSVSFDTQMPGYMPEKPSPLIVFTKMADYFVMFGVFLGIAMGFDLISKEKETRSLKTLLSHPVFRDEVVNGKAIGSALVLAIALGATIAVSVAILLMMGIVPTIGELCAILVVHRYIRDICSDLLFAGSPDVHHCAGQRNCSHLYAGNLFAHLISDTNLWVDGRRDDCRPAPQSAYRCPGLYLLQGK